MNRKWGIRILLLVFAVASLATVVRPTTPVPICETALNDSFAAPSSSIPHTELDRINPITLTVGHTAVQKDNIPIHPVTGCDQKNLYVSIETLLIRESSYLPKDYLFFIYPSHHFW